VSEGKEENGGTRTGRKERGEKKGQVFKTQAKLREISFGDLAELENRGVNYQTAE